MSSVVPSLPSVTIKPLTIDKLPLEMIYHIAEFLYYEDIENFFKALKLEIDLEWRKNNFNEFSSTKASFITFPSGWKMPISYRQTFYVRPNEILSIERIKRIEMKFESSGMNKMMRENEEGIKIED